MKKQRNLFTSESVGSGHPDKVSDAISDAVLDAMLEQDPESRVACETMVSTGMVVLAGEITTKAEIDFQKVVRKTIREIGYDDPHLRFDADSCAVLVALDKQSPDISQGVTSGKGLHKEQGAGDQGMMFGYAVRETPALMPLPIHLSHRIMEQYEKVRLGKNRLSYLRPDGKGQVTVEYDDNNKPMRVDTVVLSVQHDPKVKFATLRKDMIEKVIKKVIPAKYLDKKTIYHINPTGRFVIGGPHGDCGLTGRKIIVDTYGGKGAHGGGAFSGKDPSKVDRSAAYMARYIAKNLVAAKLSHEVEVQLAYAIGVAEPVSVRIETNGTSKYTDSQLGELVANSFDLTPTGIIKKLDLKRPIYRKTAAHGHFGRPGFSWEKTDMAEKLAKNIKKYV